MKIRRFFLICMAAVLSLSMFSCQIRDDAESGRGFSPEEARMAELFERMIEVAVQMSLGDVCMTEICTDMSEEPLAKVERVGKMELIEYVSGEKAGSLDGQRMEQTAENAWAIVPQVSDVEYLPSPLTVTGLVKEVHTPDAVLWRAEKLGILPPLSASDMEYVVDENNVTSLTVGTAYFERFARAVYGVREDAVFNEIDAVMMGFGSLSMTMSYLPTADTLTLDGTWTDGSVTNVLSVTVVSDSLTWELMQTEAEAVPYTSIVPTVKSVGTVTGPVFDEKGFVSCTVREEREVSCVDVHLLGCEAYPIDAAISIETSLTPRETTVMTQTVAQKTVKTTPAAGESGKNETLTVTVTGRTDGKYDFVMEYETYRKSECRRFSAIMEKLRPTDSVHGAVLR